MSGLSNQRAPQNINRNSYVDPYASNFPDPREELDPNGLEEKFDLTWPSSGPDSAPIPLSFSRTLDMISKLMQSSGRQITNRQSTNIEDRRGQPRPNLDDQIQMLLDKYDPNRPRTFPQSDPADHLYPNLIPGNMNSHSRQNVPGARGDQIEGLLDHLSRP